MIRHLRAAVAALLLIVLWTAGAHATASGAIGCTGVSNNFASITCPDINDEITNLDRQGIHLLSSVSGTNTITANASPYALTSYQDGQTFRLKPAVTNTSTVTLSINSLGAKAIVKQDGSALASGDLQGSVIYLLQYYGTTDHFRVMGAVGTPGVDDDVPEVGDFSALVGGSGIDNNSGTLDLDLTEISSATWGAGSFTSLTFNAGATDPVVTMGSGTVTWSGITEFDLDNEAIFKLFEGDANGSNWLGFKAPTAVTSNATCTLENDSNFIPDSCVGNGVDDTGSVSDADYGDIVVSGTGTVMTIDSNSVALGADTTNNYVQDVADGTGIDGTAAAEGATYTPTLDLTEISSATWGAGSFTTFTFDAGAVDPLLTFGSGTLLVEGVTSFRQADAANAGAFVKLLEDPGTGANFLGFQAPASVTSDATCTLENDANFIPDSCVGDGSDDDVPEVGDFGALVGGSGVDNNSGTIDLDLTELSTATFGAGAFTSLVFDAGATDPTFTFASNSITVSNAATVSLGTSAALTTGTIELGAASDTTLSRASAGVLAVEGVSVPNNNRAINTGTGLTGGGNLSADRTIAFDYSDAGASPALNADECRFTGDATTNGELVCEGDTADAFETRIVITDPTADRAFTIPNADSNPVQPLTCGGTDKVSAISATGAITCTADSGAAGGDSITVNGGAVADADFDDATPAAVSGTNVLWQKDASSPNNISAYIPAASTTVVGVAELATSAETEAGSDTGRTVTPAGLLAAFSGAKTISIPGGAITSAATSGCTASTIDSGSNDINYRVCGYTSTAADEFGWFTIAMPKSWDEGTITAQFFWTATSGTGNVVWSLACLARSDDDALDTAVGTPQTVTDALTATGDQMTSSATAAITIGGTPAEGDAIYCRAARVGSNGSDTFSGTAQLLAVKVIYNVNAMTDD